MSTDEFLKELQKAIELEDTWLTLETDLTQLDVYDSLAKLAVIILVEDTFGKTLPGDELQAVTTVKSLMELIGLEQFS